MAAIAWALGLWVGLHVVALLLAPLFVTTASTNGLFVVIPRDVRDALTEREVEAVRAHEQGHIARLHAWRNLARSCLLMRRSLATARRQELEADDYAAARGHARLLASALRKLSAHPFDIERAERLDANGQ